VGGGAKRPLPARAPRKGRAAAAHRHGGCNPESPSLQPDFTHLCNNGGRLSPVLKDTREVWGAKGVLQPRAGMVGATLRVLVGSRCKSACVGRFDERAHMR